MIIVGELIRASRQEIKHATESRDSGFIRKMAREQVEAGADYIDVNAGVFVHDEIEQLTWLVEQVQEETGSRCCIDSPDPRAIEAALAIHAGTAMINSISLEKDRYDRLLPLISGTELKIIALCMSDDGMPETTEQRLKIADRLISGLTNAGVDLDNIYVDPLVQPISTSDSYGLYFLEAVERIMNEFKGVHTICGLSNISYGLPERALLNRTFLIAAIIRGLDSAIINPLDRRMIAGVLAAEALAGRDCYCENYLTAYRAGRLNAQP